MRLTDEEKAIADEVAMRLFFDRMRPAHAWECAVNYIAARRKAFGDGPQVSPDEAVSLRSETPGTATAAGVAAPPPEASDEVVGWYVEGGSGDPIRTWEDHCNAARVARACGGTVVPLVRQGSPRGVVVTVTDQHRRAVEWARNFIKATAVRSAAVAHCYSKDLADLLDAIDAAKGGEA